MNAQNVLPGILSRMSIAPAKINIEIPPQEYLDGLAIPLNNMSFLFTDGGSGKSTGSRKAGIEAAATGRFSFLGERYHSKPLRVVLVYGEETEENIIHSIQNIPKCREHFRVASDAGRICIISMTDFQATMQKPERVFGADGSVTDFGRTMFDAIHDFRPDLVVLDTLSSLSDSEYLDGISSRNTVQFLNAFCSRARCAGIAFGHLTKGAGAKITEAVTPSELLSIARGSAMLPNSSRHFLVMVPAPKGMYSARMSDDPDDQIWIGTAKTNLQGCPLAFKIFPAIRDASEMTLSAVVEEGKTLGERVEAEDAMVLAELKVHLPIIVQAAAELRSPFAQKSSAKISMEQLSIGALAGVMPPASPSQITRALADLERVRAIVPCTPSRAGGSVVWDVPEGLFARQNEFEAVSGEKLDFKKGAPSADELKAKIEEIRSRALPVDVLDAAREIAAAKEYEELAEKAEKERAAAEKAAQAEAKKAETEARKAQEEAEKLRFEADRVSEAARLAEADAAIVAEIGPRVESIVRAAAKMLQPFAASGAMSLPGLVDLVHPAFPASIERRHLETAVSDLIRAGRITIARRTATGGAVLDVPGGPFAAPEDHLDDDKNPPKFQPGAPDIEMLIANMDRAEVPF